MPVGYQATTEAASVPGVRIGVTAAGIKSGCKPDLTVFELCEGATCAAVFTRNAFCAAPVLVARRHLEASPPRFLLINSGNANAGTGEQGERDALDACAALANLAGCPVEAVLPFSTGVIAQPLPTSKIREALPVVLAALNESGWLTGAEGILTTDTVRKVASRQVLVEGKAVTVTGMSKGSGMIHPDMATMLAFVATDATVDSKQLQTMLHKAVGCSFNRITVDGDTSTNDACVLVATGKSGVKYSSEDCPEFLALENAVTEVCTELAQAIVRDGEGATKFVEVHVEGGRSDDECRDVAYTIAHSPLVKTALFASDPNWGRILAAVGRSGVKDLDVGRVDLYLGDVCLVRQGLPDPGYTEASGQAVMDCEEIGIRVCLHRGDHAQTIWTTDLSYDYVRINAEYRT